MTSVCLKDEHPRARNEGAPATSEILESLLKDPPKDLVTLDWLMAGLHGRSFGIVMLLLGTLALIPGLSLIAGLLLFVPAFQMLMGRSRPIFPHRISAYTLHKRQLARLLRRGLKILIYLERFIRTRWRKVVKRQRAVGVVLLLLSAFLLVPIPFSNLAPALVILLISLARLEEDGVLLAVTFLTGVALLLGAAITIRALLPLF
jgi:hypothetical protein